MNEYHFIERVFIERVGMEEALGIIMATLVAIVLWLLAGLIVTRVAKGIIARQLKKKKGNQRGTTIARLASGAIKVLVWFGVILGILTELNVEITPILASAGIFGIAIGFGAQSLVKDVVAGFFIVVDNSFNIGETIEVNGFRGNVVMMNLRVTHVENFMGSLFIINNGDINQLINWSRNNNTAIVDFGVAYDTNLSKITEIMPEFMTQLDEAHEDIYEPTYLGVTALADSSINMRIMAKTTTGNQWAIERRIRKELVEFLNKHKVEIPFPQVVVHSKANKAT